MELTNIIFGIILISLMMIGMSTFVLDVNTNYKDTLKISSNGSVSQFYVATAALNEEINKTNATILNPAVSQVVTTNTQDSGIGAALGYLLGAISSLQILLTLPAVALAVINALATFAGIYFPAWLIGLVTLSVVTIMLIGLLYFLMKVR